MPAAANGVNMEIRSNRHMVQFALCLAVFLVPFMGASLNLAMPFIAADFSMSAFSLTFLVSTYLLGTALFQMPAARLGDLIGRRRVFLIGMVGLGLATLMCGLSWSGASLIFFRVLAGIGSALVFATNMAILTSVFPREQRGRALGINTAVVYLSLSVGPLLGGLLAKHFGWRSIFFVAFAMTAAATAVSVRAIRDEWIEAKGEPFDHVGGFVYALAVGGVVMGFSHLPDAMGWVLLVLGLVATLAFVRVEGRAAFPMLKLDLFFGNRHFRLSALSAMINYSASFAISFILSLYLQFVKGMEADRAGLVLMAQPLAQTILSPFAGRLSDRVNPSYLTTSGMAAISVGLALLSLLTPETPLYVAALMLFLIGTGFAMFSSPNVNLIMGSVSSRDAGLASATTGTARQIGQAMSMAMTSLIIHAYMGDREITVETAALYLPAIKTALLIFAAVCLVGVYTSASKLIGGDDSREWRHISVRGGSGEDKT